MLSRDQAGREFKLPLLNESRRPLYNSYGDEPIYFHLFLMQSYSEWKRKQ